MEEEFSVQTTTTTQTVNGSKIDYDQATVKIMKELAPKVVGRWSIRQVDVKFQKYNHGQKQLQITKDTLFQDLATLDIRPASVARHNPKQPKHPEFEGEIEFRGKTYPIYFYLLANAERVVNNKGPEAYFAFEFNFPNGTRISEPEENFLEDLGVVRDNFTLETVPGQRAMIWRGLNRGADRMQLIKQ